MTTPNDLHRDIARWAFRAARLRRLAGDGGSEPG